MLNMLYVINTKEIIVRCGVTKWTHTLLLLLLYTLSTFGIL